MSASRLTIGEFSKLCRLTIVALRHYDRIGLLAPAEIDPATGYRYYHPDQIDSALQIGLLRSLDVSIAELRPFVAGVANLDELLTAQRSRLTTQLRDRQRMIDVIDALTAGEGDAPYEISRSIEPNGSAVGLTVETSWERLERATQHGLARLAVLLRQRAVEPGANGALFPITPSEQMTVTVFAAVGIANAWAVPASLVPVALPRVDAVSTIHRGDHRLLGFAYRAVLARVAVDGLEAVGPAREYYLPEDADKVVCTRLVIPIRAHRPE
ncbi:MAG: MerR family DNA-binding transcriptional regulator [Acidimicrobiales bacterium]